MGVTDIFGMFDKVDDIILEPVKLVCDALHQPLKHLDAGIERKNKEQEHLLDVELQKLEFEIEERKKDNELNREIRRNSEIQRMQEEVKNSAFNRSKEVAEFYKQYQIDMAKIANSLSESLGNMSLELRGRATKLASESTREYLLMQKEAEKEWIETGEMVFEKYNSNPEFMMMMLRPVEKMFTNIIEQSKNFIETINRDFENMNNNIDSIVSSAMGNGNNILSSMRESFMIAPHETFTLEANNSKMLDK